MTSYFRVQCVSFKEPSSEFSPFASASDRWQEENRPWPDVGYRTAFDTIRAREQNRVAPGKPHAHINPSEIRVRAFCPVSPG
jgi:hypothetical protein